MDLESPDSYSKTRTALPPTRAQSPISIKTPLHDLKNRDNIAELLDTILPPRKHEEGGNLWIQPVSRTPATRLDVVNLQEKLDMRLSERQARELGICPVRRELYDQCFDELIRQETLNCTERGLLLVRMRDELRMTLSAFGTLYESSIAFGIRKSLLSERGRCNVEEQVKMLLFENAELREDLKQKAAEYALRQSNLEQQMAMENRKHCDEVDFLKKTNHQLKVQLKAVVGPMKKVSEGEEEEEASDQEPNSAPND